MARRLQLCSALAAASVLSTAQAATYSHYDEVPAGWTATGDADSDAVQTFSIALTMQNIEQLESKLLEVSTPGSAEYGAHWNESTVQSFFAPSGDAVSSVTAWLEQNGVSNYNVDGAFIDFGADVATANTLLNASYQQYANGDGATKLRTLSYSIPDDVQDHIVLIDPGLYFGSSKAFLPTQSKTKVKAAPESVVRRTPSRAHARSLATRTTIDASCQTSITPACLKELYNVGNYSASASSGSKVGFGSFLGESALYEDVAVYEKFYGIPSQNFSVTLIANATNDQDPDTASIGEADLDVENIIGIAHPLPVIEYITGGAP